MSKGFGISQDVMTVTAGKRIISPGSGYDHLFPTPDYKETILNGDGTVTDTVMLMGKYITRYKGDTKAIAAKLRASNVYDTCRNVFDFVYNHIQYTKDKSGVEQLRRPAYLWFNRQRGGDCDCMTIFVCSLLYNLGIPFKIRIAKYEGAQDFGHVYTVVPYHATEIIIDTVLDTFNYEKTPRINKDFTMQQLGIPIVGLHGIEQSEFDITPGTGSITMPDETMLVMGFEGFGAISTPSEKDQYDYLVTLRKYVTQHPNKIHGENPASFIKLLTYVIDNYWKKPETRAKAIEIAAAQAKDIEVEDDDQMSGLGKIKLGNIFKAIKNVAKDGLKVLNKVNPALIAIRNAFRGLLALNFNGLATRMYVGSLSQDEWKKTNVPKADYDHLKKSWDKFTKTWTNMGGSVSALRAAAKEGRNKKAITGKAAELQKEAKGTHGLGEPVTIALVTAASGILVAAINMFGGNKDAAKAVLATTAQETFKTLPKDVQDKMQPLISAGKTVEQAYQTVKQSQKDKSLPDSLTPDIPMAEQGFFGKIKDFIRTKPMVTAGIGVALVGGIYLLIRKKKPQAHAALHGLEGIKHPAKKKLPPKTVTSIMR